jgi:hypothetical protein
MIYVDCFSAPLTFANGSTTVIAKSGKVLAPASGAHALGSRWNISRVQSRNT